MNCPACDFHGNAGRPCPSCGYATAPNGSQTPPFATVAGAAVYLAPDGLSVVWVLVEPVAHLDSVTIDYEAVDGGLIQGDVPADGMWHRLAAQYPPYRRRFITAADLETVAAAFDVDPSILGGLALYDPDYDIDGPLDALDARIDADHHRAGDRRAQQQTEAWLNPPRRPDPTDILDHP